MADRKSVRILNSLDLESLRTSLALKSSEALKRDLTRPCDKLKESADFLLAHLSKNLPEPPYLLTRLCVANIICIGSQVTHYTAHKLLKNLKISYN